MDQTYQFSKHDEWDPTGTQVKESVNTAIRGNDPSFESIMKGMESFLLGCGFELNGSGIGRIPPAE